MRKIAMIVTVVCTLASVGVTGAEAAEKDTIRVLLTYGGHGFNRKAFLQMFDDMPEVEYTSAKLPKTVDLLKPGLEQKYDVVVRYDMVKSFSPAQRKAFIGLLGEGIGLVSIHHNLGAHRDWDEYAKIVGGKYVFKQKSINGKKQQRSSFAHGRDIDVEVIDSNHPVTKAVSDFTIHDETYKDCWHDPHAKILLATDQAESDRQIAWVTQYAKSRIFCLQLGHNADAWRHPAYGKLLLNGIRWAAGRDD